MAVPRGHASTRQARTIEGPAPPDSLLSTHLLMILESTSPAPPVSRLRWFSGQCLLWAIRPTAVLQNFTRIASNVPSVHDIRSKHFPLYPLMLKQLISAELIHPLHICQVLPNIHQLIEELPQDRSCGHPAQRYQQHKILHCLTITDAEKVTGDCKDKFSSTGLLQGSRAQAVINQVCEHPMRFYVAKENTLRSQAAGISAH